jgi:cell wall-associated NlpC family hydrolase
MKPNLGLILGLYIWLTILPLGVSSSLAADPFNLPQDLLSYVSGPLAEQDLIPPDQAKGYDQKYNQAFFFPWHLKETQSGKELAAARFQRYLMNPGFGEKQRPHSADWVERLAGRADLEKVSPSGFRAITTAHTDLRELPTREPHFDRDGGYPFDNLQYSAVEVNTPVYVYHQTKDRTWVLVFSHYGTGWVPSGDLAPVENNFISTWENNPLVAVIKDQASIRDQAGTILLRASVGSLFPVTGESEEGYRILTASGNKKKNASGKRAIIPKAVAVVKPHKITPSNIARLGNELLHKPYGWGGISENRDCSATLKDLFAPFGIWLPRDSQDQGSHGLFISLESLPAEEKERSILKDGIPFLTLIRTEGHIMLYIGSYQGRAVVFHNTWGVPTRDLQGREGKKIIGRSIVSTLYLGMDPKNPQDKGLLDYVKGMTHLVPPESVSRPERWKPGNGNR